MTETSEVRGEKLVKQFTKMVDSILLYSKVMKNIAVRFFSDISINQGTPLRLIFLTDNSSVESISSLLRRRVSRSVQKQLD